ncbi:uncharacterized protein LOC131033516 isoform X2 [Cryptomeria japonica]|uniref:uncharacterized protein LOC131033516 isoform X2 n=1 Tax=Cryptomeria japonica TaxID=3369 RepID=UPI0025AB6D41|nr:uncharacterized protein LOC131033516 isoform X2 [Cryptomeria japonica]
MTDQTGQVLLMLIASLSLLAPSYASIGDSDPLYRTCVENCEKNGCVEETCFSSCKLPVNGASIEGAWFMQEPLYLRWKEWDCRIDCRYHCMVKRESERDILGQKPVKYHGKWPFKRVFGFQEPVSVAFSALNLAVQFHGWLSFVILVYYKLPLRPHNRSTYYEFTGLWNIYGILSMNAWFWSAVFHSRDVELTEKLDYSSAVALMGFSLIVAILRTFDVKDEAARVMVAAPLIAFVTTHILYLNFYELDYAQSKTNIQVTAGETQVISISHFDNIKIFNEKKSYMSLLSKSKVLMEKIHLSHQNIRSEA